MKVGWGGRIRTYDTRYQKPMPYHLATPHQNNSLLTCSPGRGPQIVSLRSAQAGE